MRDRVVNFICNWLLNHVATKAYRDKIAAICGLGMVAMIDRAEMEQEVRRDDEDMLYP